MPNKIKIEAFALSFHLEKSKSQEIIVTSPLESYLSFSFRSWNGTDLPPIKDKYAPLLFFQYPPPHKLLKERKTRLIWIPMWDHIRNYREDWWNSLPKTLKIIAFSKAVYEKAKNAGLNTLYLQYFVSPAQFKRANWKDKRVLFYWNRIGLIGRDDLIKICEALNIEKIYFQNQLDPGIIKTLNYDLPPQIGKTEVVKLPHYLSRKEYIHILEDSNIYIAPRLYEGIGISFIETLARGACVLAADAPTMNEYIQHKKNGYLLSHKKNEGFLQYLKQAASIRVPEMIGGRRRQIQLSFNIDELEKINIVELGIYAYKQSEVGYEIWKSKLKMYADFITNW